MADTENKDIDFNKAKAELDKKDTREAKAKKPHSKKSFGWWAGVIILILISITFILPATGISFLFMDDSIEFGRYDGEPIAYENGSYMYNQYINLYTQYGGYMDSNSLLYQAYYNSVLNLALTQKAEKVTASAAKIASFVRVMPSPLARSIPRKFRGSLRASCACRCPRRFRTNPLFP